MEPRTLDKINEIKKNIDQAKSLQAQTEKMQNEIVEEALNMVVRAGVSPLALIDAARKKDFAGRWL